MNYRSLMRSINYIYWKKEAIKKKCTFDEFNAVVDRLKEQGTKIKYSTKREDYDNLCYSIVNSKQFNNKLIYVYENGKYYMYYTNKIDDAKNKREEAFGFDGIKKVQVEFVKDTGKGFKVAFGYVDDKFKRCIPKIFSYSNANYYGRVVRTSSVDFSSHWPYNAQGKLPDSHTAIEYQGTVKPTEEYPFAFYLKSGHVAEYGRFDSHNWVKSPLMDYMFRYNKKEEKFPQKPFLKPEEDITVLMKPSQYELGKYYKQFYDMRKEDKNAKLYANASLGYMHTKKYTTYKMAHIVAIVLGRAQDKTIEAMNEIGQMHIVHAVVDGFMYTPKIKLGKEEKEFGALHQEWINCNTCVKATNCYIVIDDSGKCIKVKHSGYECRKDGSEINEDTVKDFNDFENWIAKRGVE